jgi:hypothetical protein
MAFNGILLRGPSEQRQLPVQLIAPLWAPSNSARHGDLPFFLLSLFSTLFSLCSVVVLLASLIEALDYWLHEVKHILNLLTSLQ